MGLGTRSTLRLFAAMLLSLVIYFAVSATLLNKPVTYDSITRMMQRKLGYAKSLPSPKLVLIGGSGVRTSHRCDVLSAQLGWPCVNGGSTVGLSLNYVFAEYKPLLKRGDVVYLPLEYQQYTISKAEALTGPDAAILFRKDWQQLFDRGPEGFARAAFMADIDFISQSAIEQALAGAGVRARFDKQTSDPQGDQTGLTHQAGKPYDAYIANVRWYPPTPAQFEAAHGAKDEIARFLDWCREHGIRVIGGLPVAFDKPIVTDNLVATIRAFYAAHGGGFIVMSNRSQYPRDFFYDTPFHLEEEHAVAHSLLLAPYLRQQIGAWPGGKYRSVVK